MKKVEGFEVFSKETGEKMADENGFAITNSGLLMMRGHSGWIEAPRNVFYIWRGEDLEEY